MIQTRNNRVTICACASRLLMDKERLVQTAIALKSKGYEVEIVPDLCRMAMLEADETREVAVSVVVACYPRAVRALFDTVGMQPRQVIDIRNNDTQHVLEELGESPTWSSETAQGEEEFRRQIESFATETGRDAWYPVLDKERCCDCGKCHDFCLFGVYTIEGAKVKVREPQSCKNNCPACARMCPTKAIIFPKYEKSPINGGLEDEEQALSVDPNAAYAQSLRERLAQRRAGITFLRREKK